MKVKAMRNLSIRLLVMLTLTLMALPSWGMTNKPAMEETEGSIGATIPEPQALLLFAAGALLVFWTLRRRRATS